MMNGLFRAASGALGRSGTSGMISGVYVSPGKVYQGFQDINQVLSLLAWLILGISWGE